MCSKADCWCRHGLLYGRLLVLLKCALDVSLDAKFESSGLAAEILALIGFHMAAILETLDGRHPISWGNVPD